MLFVSELVGLTMVGRTSVYMVIYGVMWSSMSMVTGMITWMRCNGNRGNGMNGTMNVNVGGMMVGWMMIVLWVVCGMGMLVGWRM